MGELTIRQPQLNSAKSQVGYQFYFNEEQRKAIAGFLHILLDRLLNDKYSLNALRNGPTFPSGTCS